MARMLKSSEVAERLGRHEETLKRWRRRTEKQGVATGPPFVRVETGSVLYPEDGLEQWIKDRTVAA